MAIYSVREESAIEWRETTFRNLGYGEAYLEALIASSPSILGLDPYLTGMGSRFVAFRQSSLSSSDARNIRPDVVLLSDTGHIVLVEVKLSDNDELRDRRVIAQVVDYAAAISQMGESTMASWLGGSQGETWHEFVQSKFPEAANSRALADAILDRVSRADIHIVVACDRAPLGLREAFERISAQSALGEFQVHLVEVVPYQNPDNLLQVMVSPREVAKTQVVSRTAVSISVNGGEGLDISVSASSAEDLAEAMGPARRKIRQEFRAAVDAWNSRGGVAAAGRSRDFRQVRIADWPAGVHFEFLDHGADEALIGAELHIESREHPKLCEALQQAMPNVRAELSSARYDAEWNVGCRISVPVDDSNPEAVSQSMSTLIDVTRSIVDEYLAHPSAN